MEYYGYDKLSKDAERRMTSKYTIQGGAFSQPSWINASRRPRNSRAALAWTKHREANWNSTVRTYAPLCFKGLKPVTMEPWAVDAILYECPADRIGGRDNKDIQAKMLDEALGYRAALRNRRVLKESLRSADYEC